MSRLLNESAIPTSVSIVEIREPSDFVRRCAARAAEATVEDFHARMRARKAQARAARKAIVPGRVVRA